MVSHTVLCAFVLALVAVCQSKPHHDQEFMSRGFQQQRHDLERLMAQRRHHQQQEYEMNQDSQEQHGKRHHQQKQTERYQDQDQQSSEEQRRGEQYESLKYQSEEKYSQKHGEQQGRQQQRQYEDDSQEESKYGYQQSKKSGPKPQEHQDTGKLQKCDGNEDMEQPCVVENKRNKQVRVQDTSSDESQEQRRTIKMVTSQEDRSSSVEVKQAPKPIPIHHGKGTQYHYEQQRNVQTSRRGNDDDDSQSFEDNSQERKNKLHKY